ncbi:MAG: DNA-3-methyladenine glycosylase I [Acidobacteriota bacterium]
MIDLFSTSVSRCPWPADDLLMIAYHDTEWGVPLHDDLRLFEFMVLDTFQAGLNWKTILHKRDSFRNSFAGFDPARVARFNNTKIARLLQDIRIIRNRLKIEATVRNARAFLQIQEEFGSFDDYLWAFVDGKPRINRWKTLRQIPANTLLSDALSKDLKRRGFSFIGSTICYAFMQAAGLVNDHLISCFRHAELERLARNTSNY